MGVEKKKLRILNRLAESGFDTEKKVMALDKYELVDFCLDNGMQLSDTKVILELQKAIKDKKVYSFYAGGIDETEEKEDDGNERTGSEDQVALGTEGTDRDDGGRHFGVY